MILPEKFTALLTARESFILSKRYGNNHQTLAELARYFQLSRERIRQLECRALRKLERQGLKEDFKVFINEIKKNPTV